MYFISRALLSVSDKTGIVEFARALVSHGVSILSTGGTAKLLTNSGIKVLEVSDYTGFPEMLNGRLKTLHPKIHGGILGSRDNLEHVKTMSEHRIDAIDLVCVNLYPFTKTVARENCSIDEAIENIDIGGPTMLRAAAKNWQYVSVVTDIADYADICMELDSFNGALSRQTRFSLAKKAFLYSSNYDKAIYDYFGGQLSKEKPNIENKILPEKLNQNFTKVQDLRYGENPHQAAAFYFLNDNNDKMPIRYNQLHGKEMSYNNIIDADAALETVKEFFEPACVIVKHANPCGVAQSDSLLEAYRLALDTDKISSFGGIVAFNRRLDVQTAIHLSGQFIEVLIAPSFDSDALSIVSSKKNIRILEADFSVGACNNLDIKRALGGYVIQETNNHRLEVAEATCPSKREPTQKEIEDLIFAWKVVKHVKSNAVVFCKDGRTLGIGAGQMSRVDSTFIAAKKAVDAGLSLIGAVAASDAFFPFRDGIDIIAQHGITAIIHPGGSVRDVEVVCAANEHSIAMLVTGIRHFYH